MKNNNNKTMQAAVVPAMIMVTRRRWHIGRKASHRGKETDGKTNGLGLVLARQHRPCSFSRFTRLPFGPAAASSSGFYSIFAIPTKPSLSMGVDFLSGFQSQESPVQLPHLPAGSDAFRPHFWFSQFAVRQFVRKFKAPLSDHKDVALNPRRGEIGHRASSPTSTRGAGQRGLVERDYRCASAGQKLRGGDPWPIDRVVVPFAQQSIKNESRCDCKMEQQIDEKHAEEILHVVRATNRKAFFSSSSSSAALKVGGRATAAATVSKPCSGIKCLFSSIQRRCEGHAPNGPATPSSSPPWSSAADGDDDDDDDDDVAEATLVYVSERPIQQAAAIRWKHMVSKADKSTVPGVAVNDMFQIDNRRSLEALRVKSKPE
jgi:hypothetical protein